MTIEATLTSIDNSLKALLALQQDKPIPKVGAKPPAADPTTPASKALTYDDVKVPFLDLVKSRGRDAGVKVLAQFKAEKLPDIKPGDFAAVLAAIKEATKAEAALA